MHRIVMKAILKANKQVVLTNKHQNFSMMDIVASSLIMTL